MLKKVIGFVGFQSSWAASVLGASSGIYWLGPVFVVAWFIISVLLSGAIRRDLILACIAAFVGICIDSALLALHAFSPNGTGPLGLSPFWMVGLWVNFATILNTAFAWVKGHYLLAAILGAAGGPFAYYSGAKLGAAVLAEPLMLSLALIGLGWAIAFPFLVWTSERVR
jgi:hypothetical protein